jgi:hypothetical protein
MDENMNAKATVDASVIRGGGMGEQTEAHGRFVFECVGPHGEVKWAETIENVVCTAGKNLAFDTFLAGSNYTVTGPFMGLISSVGFSAVSAGDTMSSHADWLEAGGANAPTYTAPRNTCAWNAASAGCKALSSALSFVFTSAGTIEGAFLTYGPGAVSTIDNTGGTLWSAGVFSGGAKAVGGGDTLNVSYSVSM